MMEFPLKIFSNWADTQLFRNVLAFNIEYKKQFFSSHA